MYDHYIALDWSQKVMALAHFCAKSSAIDVFEADAEIAVLKSFVKKLKGRKILTVEEGGQAQWIYIELKNLVDDLIVCDPYRNHLLKEGSKSDKVDAVKLLKLLRADLLKPVFHVDDDLIYMRNLASGYDDLIYSGVRLKNQAKALLARRCPSKDPHHRFVLDGLGDRLSLYESERERYKSKFCELTEKNRIVRLLYSIPGIGPVGAVKIAAIVVSAKRFQTRGHYLSYCGLIKLDRVSGGKSYGQKRPRHLRQLKAVYKTAAMAIINGPDKCPLKKYYKTKLTSGLAEFQARHALARRVATLSFGVMKRDEAYNVRRLKN